MTGNAGVQDKNKKWTEGKEKFDPNSCYEGGRKRDGRGEDGSRARNERAGRPVSGFSDTATVECCFLFGSAHCRELKNLKYRFESGNSVSLIYSQHLVSEVGF